MCSLLPIRTHKVSVIVSIFFWTIRSRFAHNTQKSSPVFQSSIQGLSFKCEFDSRRGAFPSTWRSTSRSCISIYPFLPCGWSVRNYRRVTFRFSLSLCECMINTLCSQWGSFARENTTNTIALTHRRSSTNLI